MEPIDNISRTMEVLRREMARNMERLRREGKLQPATPSTELKQRPPLRQIVVRAVKALDANDPRFAEKAGNAFVESVLLAEFGENLVNDPEFRHLIHQVTTTMLTDKVFGTDLAQLVQQLRTE